MTRIRQTLLIDWQQKTQQIHAVERDLAGVLAQTPWILLMSHPGINVVSAAEIAGETGPIEHYASPKAISDRAADLPASEPTGSRLHAGEAADLSLRT